MKEQAKGKEADTKARTDDWDLRAELIRGHHETLAASAKASEEVVGVLLGDRDLKKAGISGEGEVPSDVLKWQDEFMRRAGES